MKMTRTLIAFLLIGQVLTGCAASQSSGAYSRQNARQVQDVEWGTVQSIRPVQIEGTKSGVGAIAGGAAGGVAGKGIGRGRTGTLGAIGGAVVGGVAGAVTEEVVTRRRGVEITVRLDGGRTIAVTQEDDQPITPGDRVKLVTAPDGTARIAQY